MKDVVFRKLLHLKKSLDCRNFEDGFEDFEKLIRWMIRTRPEQRPYWYDMLSKCDCEL